MKDFTTFFNDLSRKVFKDCPTGDELADSLNKITFNIKVETLKNKMREYKNIIDNFIVDIPEFCKPESERFETFIDNRIKEIVNNNQLDYFYNQIKA